MNLEQYKSKVFEQLTFSKVDLDNLKEDDLKIVVMVIEDKHSKEWEIKDTVWYIKHLEEVNPGLEEDYALGIMGGISSKYKA